MIKKVCRKIKLKKYRSELTEEVCKETDNTHFIIVYVNGQWEYGDCWDVRKALENDHIKKINCIFDANDRISIFRDIIIDTDAIEKGE